MTSIRRHPLVEIERFRYYDPTQETTLRLSIAAHSIVIAVYCIYHYCNLRANNTKQQQHLFIKPAS